MSSRCNGVGVRVSAKSHVLFDRVRGQSLDFAPKQGFSHLTLACCTIFPQCLAGMCKATFSVFFLLGLAL